MNGVLDLSRCNSATVSVCSTTETLRMINPIGNVGVGRHEVQHCKTAPQHIVSENLLGCTVQAVQLLQSSVVQEDAKEATKTPWVREIDVSSSMLRAQFAKIFEGSEIKKSARPEYPTYTEPEEEELAFLGGKGKGRCHQDVASLLDKLIAKCKDANLSSQPFFRGLPEMDCVQSARDIFLIGEDLIEVRSSAAPGTTSSSAGTNTSLGFALLSCLSRS